MANYLFGYNTQNGICGVDILEWQTAWLSGNTPFTCSTETSLTGYANITSPENWDNWGEYMGLRHCEVYDEIKEIYNLSGTTWSGSSTEDKQVFAKYFIASKSERDEVYAQAEQDEFDHFKIYHFMSDDVFENMSNINSKITPKSLDYKKDLKQRLNPEYKFDIKGFLTGVTYYENLSVDPQTSVFTFSNPIVRYTAQYSQNADGYVTSRVVTRSWQLMSDQWSPDVKTTVKIYDTKTSREEGNRRRRNLINNLLIDTVGLIYMTSSGLTTISETEADAIPFLTEVDSGIKLYYESGAKENTQGEPCLLIQQVSGSTYNRLDNIVPPTTGTTIRDYIINRLDP